jgi:LUD domain
MALSSLMSTDELPAIDGALLDALRARGFEAHAVADSAEARGAVLALIPDGALVSSGGSTTLEEIGLADALRSAERFRYGNSEWLAEDDLDRRLEIRKRNSIFADIYLGSVQAVARTGQVVGSDWGGSRQGPYVWGPRRVIWVVGANKIVPNLDAAVRRVYQIALPLEDLRMRKSGGAGSGVNKLVVYDREPVHGRTLIVLVPEALGF